MKGLASSQPHHSSPSIVVGLASSPTLLTLTEERPFSFYSIELLPHYLLYSHISSGLLIMKSSILLAASTLGSAMAGIHRMPLKKMPLTEQLVSKSVKGSLQLPKLSLIFTPPVPQRYQHPNEGSRPEIHGHPSPEALRGDVQSR